MTLSPLDDYPVHQAALPIRHPATSDRNFYDRYYFNCHAGTDELMLIIGLGQYPNLGVTDAFALARHGDTHRVVRASRELGIDRMDTSVGPFRVQVIEGLRSLRVVLEPNEYDLEFDLTLGWRHPRAGRAPALHPPAAASHLRLRAACPDGQVVRLRAQRRRSLHRYPRSLAGRARPILGCPPGRRERAAWHPVEESGAVLLDVLPYAVRRVLDPDDHPGGRGRQPAPGRGGAGLARQRGQAAPAARQS